MSKTIPCIEEREQCCRDVCQQCREGLPAKTVVNTGQWLHETNDSVSLCLASEIRDRADKSGQLIPSKLEPNAETKAAYWEAQYNLLHGLIGRLRQMRSFDRQFISTLPTGIDLEKDVCPPVQLIKDMAHNMIAPEVLRRWRRSMGDDSYEIVLCAELLVVQNWETFDALPVPRK